MADKTVLIKLDVQEQGAISSIEQLRNSLKNLDNNSEEYANTLKKIQSEEAKLASIQAKRVKSQKVVSKSMKKATDATGSATAATMELSRVISDAPYGIRGMANNITQLVSQLGTASTKTGGLGAALKLMGSQLTGPLGVVFAITAVVSAFDYFYGGAKGASESTSELRSELDSLVDTLDNLSIAQSDVNDKILEYIEYRALSSKSEKELKELTEDLSDLDEEINTKKTINGIRRLCIFR